MVRTLRAELGTTQGTVKRVAQQLSYGVESVRSWVKQAEIDSGETPGSPRRRRLGSKQLDTTFTLRSGSRERPVTYTALEPNRWIDFETKSPKIGPMRPTARLSFEPTATGTRLSITAESNLPWPLNPLEPLANRKGKQEWDGRLERMRVDLERDR